MQRQDLLGFYNFSKFLIYLYKMGYHLISVEPLIKITGLDGPVIRILSGIFIGKYHSVSWLQFRVCLHGTMPSSH